LPNRTLSRKGSTGGRKRRQNPSPLPKREPTDDFSALSQTFQEEKLKIDTQSTLQESQSAQSFDLGDLQYANAHGFFDINQSYSNTPQQVAPPTFSTQQDQTFSGSPSLPQSNFPLADLSAMMFPNPEDPFAYPSQSTDMNYDLLMKSINRAGTGNFPFSAPMDGDRLQRNGFVPPSSTFMFARSGEQQTPTNDSDVQLLGPMPMYMMQGASNIDSPVTPSLQMSSGTGTATGSPVPAQQMQNGRNEHNVKFYSNGPPNVNLDSLLGGEEWTGLPADRSALNTFVSNNTVSMNDGMFRKRAMIAQQQQQQHLQQQDQQQQSLQFQDLAPGVLGWGLEGF
jgi:hypothetical protein